jgi:hypothetical protein
MIAPGIPKHVSSIPKQASGIPKHVSGVPKQASGHYFFFGCPILLVGA